MEPIKTFKYRPIPNIYVNDDWIYRHNEWYKLYGNSNNSEKATKKKI